MFFAKFTDNLIDWRNATVFHVIDSAHDRGHHAFMFKLLFELNNSLLKSINARLKFGNCH
jgi:hypothetical protein